MARRKEKKIDELVRMTAAVERLEHLVDDADSGILAGHGKTEPVKPDTIVKRRSARVTRPVQRTSLELEIPNSGDSWDARLSVEPKTPPAKPKSISDFVLPTLQAHPRHVESASLTKPKRGLVARILAHVLGAEASALKSALSASVRPLATLMLFSVVIHLLMISAAVVTMMIIDRAVTARSFHVLAELVVFGLALCGAYAALDLSRHRICVRIGDDIDRQVHRAIFETELRTAFQARRSKSTASDDLEGLLYPFSSMSLLGFLDALCAPVLIAAIFALSIPLGLFAVAATMITVVIVRALGRHSMKLKAAQSDSGVRVEAFTRDLHSHAETFSVMGTIARPLHRWQSLYDQWRSARLNNSNQIGTLSTMLASLRILLTILFGTMAAGLALVQTLSIGAFIASVLLFACALDMMARPTRRMSYLSEALIRARRLHGVLVTSQTVASTTHWPRPSGQFDVQKLRLAAPGTGRLIVNGVSFTVGPGQILAITGSSGSGKSTVLKALAGQWPIFGGSIELDGRRVDHSIGAAIGQHIGYLAQGPNCMPGRVAENISSFRVGDATDDVIKAAEAADAHRFVKKLPNGYYTDIDVDSACLTHGQMQRISLARAYYSTPQLILLDNPDANLDHPGRLALLSALQGMRKNGQTIILVTQHADVLAVADLVVWLDAGRQRASGAPGDVLMRLLDNETSSVATKPVHSVEKADDDIEDSYDGMSA